MSKNNSINIWHNANNLGGHIAHLFLVCLCVILFLSAANAMAANDRDIYINSINAAQKCRESLHDKQDIVLIGDVLCAYGTIDKAFSEKFRSFKIKSGMYVVFRSGGGDLLSSVEVGNHIIDNNITLVVSDFCLSGCANYAFLAAQRKVVLQNSIVAWHGGAPDPAKATPDVLEIRTKEREEEDLFFKKIKVDPRLVRDIPKSTSITEETKKNKLWSHSPFVLRDEWGLEGIVYMWFPSEQFSDKIPE